MKQIREFFKGFSIGRVFIPLMITFGLCFLYNLGYLLSIFSISSFALAYLVQILLSLLSSLGLYFICTRLWPRKKGTFAMKKLILVLFIQAIYILLVRGILVPLYAVGPEIAPVRFLLQIAATFGIIFMIPAQLIAYFGIYEEKDNPRQLISWVGTVLKKGAKPILNGFCGLFLIMVVCDSIWYGVYSFSAGFDPLNVLVTMLFAGNPLMSWMQLMMVGMLQGLSLQQMWAPVFGAFLLGFAYTILELNYILIVRRECLKYGS